MGRLFANLFNRFRSATSTATVEAAIFGKHPGAADHFEILPAGDAILQDIFLLLYRNSMEKLLASWETLTPEERLPEFNHIWLWKRGNDWVAGRMWSSADTSRRASPLNVCVHRNGPLGDFLIKSVMPALARVEADCKKTDSINQVRQMVETTRKKLAELAEKSGVDATYPQGWLKRFVERPEFADEPESLRCLLYPFNHELSAREGDDSQSPSDTKMLRNLLSAHSLRMPRCAESAEESLLVWQALLDKVETAPGQTLLIAPLDQPWIDILTRAITPAGLYCIRASRQKRRIVTDAREDVPAEFVPIADRFIAAAKNPDQAQATAREPSRRPRSDTGPGSGKKNLPLLLLAIGILTVGGALFALIHYRATYPPVENANTPPLPHATPGTDAPPAPRVIAATVPSTASVSGAQDKPPPRTAQNPPNTQPAPSLTVAPPQDPLDPRTAWTGQKKLDEIAARIGELNNEFGVAAPDAGKLEGLQDRIARLRNRPLKGGDQAPIQAEMESIDSDAVLLLKKLDANLRQRRAQSSWASESKAMMSPVKGEILSVSWENFKKRILQSGGPIETQRGSLQILKRLFEEIDAKLPSPVPGPVSAPLPDLPWCKTLAGRIDALHAENLRQAGTLIRWNGDIPQEGLGDALKKLADADRQFPASAVAAALDAVEIEAMLNRFRPLNEAPAGANSSTLARYTDLQNQAAFKDQVVRKALEPITRRVDQLADIDKQSDSAALLKSAGAVPAPPLEQRIAIWRKLGSFADVEFPTHLQLAKALSAEIDGISDSQTKTALASELKEERIRRWVSAASRAATPEATLALIDMIEPAGIPADRITAPQIHYDVLLRSLKATTAANQQDVPRKLEEFINGVEKLGPLVTAAPSVAKFIADVRALRAEEDRTRVDSGPLEKDGWKRQAMTGGIRCTRQARDGAIREIDFVYIAPPDGKMAPFYLASSECSVQTLVDLLESPDARQAVLAVSEDAAARKGPRGWAWNDVNGKPAGAMPAKQWWPHDERTGDYPIAGAPLAPPSSNHPVQQVSIPVAAMLALKLHCRLPTSAEWRAALSSGPLDNSGHPNLRDRAFAEQIKYLDSLKSDQQPQSLDSGIFIAEKVKPLRDLHSLVWNPARSAGVPPLSPPENVYDDGVLLFRPATPIAPAGRAALSDMLGNVAEFVYDDTNAWPLLAARSGKDFIAIFEKEPAKCAVIGASALSPPEMDMQGLDRPHPLTAGQVRKAFSDVGFRLAFSAPLDPPADRFRDLIVRQPFLPCASGPPGR